jgi:hypothetical protein
MPLFQRFIIPKWLPNLDQTLDIGDNQLAYTKSDDFTTTTSIPFSKIDWERTRITETMAVVKYETPKGYQNSIRVPLYLYDPEAIEALRSIKPNQARTSRPADR